MQLLQQPCLLEIANPLHVLEMFFVLQFTPVKLLQHDRVFGMLHLSALLLKTFD